MLDIAPTKSTPAIRFDEDEHLLSITGESYPENTFEFFSPLFTWLHETIPLLDAITLDVNIRYMNSSSTKCILDILDILGEASVRGCTVAVRWYYDEENNRALDIAEEFEEDAGVPFAIIPVSGHPDI